MIKVTRLVIINRQWEGRLDQLYCIWAREVGG